jgi:aspartate beta-hydroxylase
VPLVDITQHAPEVFFSILRPGTHIPPHYGLSNYKLAVHLPLVIPADCAIRVGAETHHWQQGKVVVFDDSFEHEAWNRSEQMRAVLIFEIWHPQLNEGEKAAIRAGIGTLLQFNEQYGTRLQLRGQ